VVIKLDTGKINKVTIEDILKDKPNNRLLLAKILVQTTATNGNVAGVIKEMEQIKQKHHEEHTDCLELVAKNREYTDDCMADVKTELKDTVKGKWFKIIAIIGSALLILFNVWDRVQQYYIGI